MFVGNFEPCSRAAFRIKNEDGVVVDDPEAPRKRGKPSLAVFVHIVRCSWLDTFVHSTPLVAVSVMRIVMQQSLVPPSVHVVSVVRIVMLRKLDVVVLFTLLPLVLVECGIVLYLLVPPFVHVYASSEFCHVQ